METFDHEKRADGIVESFNVRGLPLASGWPYKHITVIDNGTSYTLMLSGMLGTDASSKLAGEDMYSQTMQALANIKTAIAATAHYLNVHLEKGSELQAITVTRADVADLTQILELNRAYIAANMPFTSRTALEVRKLPLNAAVEITAVAVLEKSRVPLES